MLQRLAVILLVVTLIAARGISIDHYCRHETNRPLHIYSPGPESTDPMNGKPIPQPVSVALGLIVGEPPEYSEGFFGVCRLRVGKSRKAYILREPGMYDSSLLALYYYNPKESVLQKQLDLADDWGDAGFIYEKDSWLLDLDGDGYLDIVSKELKYNMNLEEMGTPPDIERNIMVLLNRKNGFISSPHYRINAETFKLKHNEELWQEQVK